MKVLVAVDQDLESRLALRYACHLLEHFDAEVDAVHVKKDVGNIILEDYDIPFLKKDHKKRIDEQAKEVESAISDACEICLEGKVPCEPRILGSQGTLPSRHISQASEIADSTSLACSSILFL